VLRGKTFDYVITVCDCRQLSYRSFSYPCKWCGCYEPGVPENDIACETLKAKGMAIWQYVVRVAALTLLLIAACDVLVVDTAFAAACGSNEQTSTTTPTSNPVPPDEDCYCCCTHIVLTAAPKLVFSEILESVSVDLVPAVPVSDPKPIPHPPKI
jgi:hypothetical protein